MKRLFLILIAASSGTAILAQQPSTSVDQQKALDVLRKTMAEQERQVNASRVPNYSSRVPTFAEVEEQYLQGKISAKQFQKLIQQHKLEPGKVKAASPTPDQNKAVAVLRGDTPAAAQTPAPGPANVRPAPNTAKPPTTATRPGQRPGEQAVISEVERRMDELIRKRAERQEATNTVTTPSGPKTKRQRLDDLLKLYIEGKIQEADYNQQRAKIIAEPD